MSINNMITKNVAGEWWCNMFKTIIKGIIIAWVITSAEIDLLTVYVA